MGDTRVVVLHVDDDSEFGRLVAASLEHESERFDVLTAEGGETALERLESGDIDCVVSDYDMPGMDALELLDAVGTRHGDVPFVLFTGQGSEEIGSAAISAGVDEYLQKGSRPEQFALLANRVLTLVGRHRAREACE